MAAPKGNNFYLKRSSSGREKLFDSPESLWEAACEYFNHCDDNPWIKKEAIKSGDMAGTCMEVETQRPYTKTGLVVFLGCTLDTLQNYGKKEVYKDFFAVVKKIEDIIYTQKFEGAAVGAFNSNIIARDLGMVDKVDNTSSDGSMTPKTVTVKYKGKDLDLGCD